MSIEQMKAAILDSRPGYFHKIKSMPDKQIAAMYYRMLANNDL